MDLPHDIEQPKGIELRDLNDHPSLRKQIFDNVLKTTEQVFPMSYGGVRLEVEDLHYDRDHDYDLSEQKDALLHDRYLTRKLRGTFKLYDENTNKLLDKKSLSIMKVPWLSERGTFIHGGNEYASIMQSRLLPGVYTRRQANGHLETQFNLRPGTGNGFRLGFEPDTAQYRLKISQANLHLYSLLHDLGTPDEELKKRWGEDVFEANKKKYDSRVFEKAYMRLVPARERNSEASKEEKAAAVQRALDKARVHRNVVAKNLPGMMSLKAASEQRAVWFGREVLRKKAEEALDAIPFEPDFDAHEVLQNNYEFEFEKKAALKAGPLATLLKAKEHSDKGEYDRKSRLMLLLMQARPDEFYVDSDLDKPYPGITHKPTGFKIHVPREIIPKVVQSKAVGSGQAQVEDEPADLKKKTYYHGTPRRELDENYNDRLVYSLVPRSGLDSIKRRGLMSSSAIVKDEEALKEIAGLIGKDPESWKNKINEGINSWRSDSLKGPNVISHLPPKTLQLSEKHPTNSEDLVAIQIAIDRLIQDDPTVQLHGSELVPYDTEESKRLGDSYADLRHSILSPDDFDSIMARSAEDLWKAYEDNDNVGYYAPNVPHMSVINERGIIDPKYLIFPGDELNKQASQAKGIPDRSDYGDLNQLQAGQLLDYIVQEHNARRAGRHFDYRIGSPDTGLFSWASRYSPEELDRPIGLFQQPLHDYDYKGFEGTIEDGYGAGEVRKLFETPVLVSRVSDNAISFTTGGKYPKRFALVRPKEGEKWLMVKSKVPEQHRAEKIHYKDRSNEDVEALLKNLEEGSIVQPKLDGALAFLQMENNKYPEILSHRISKKTGKPIFHTERFFRGVPSLYELPKEFRDVVVRSELFGERGGQVIPPQELSGLLNSSLEKSIRDMDERNIQLKAMLFDVARAGGKDLSEVPYQERRALLDELLKHLPENKFVLPPEARTPVEALALYKEVSEGKHPWTEEGIVIHPPSGKPQKIKLFNEYDVYIRNTFPGEGRLAELGIPGGFEYSHQPDGPIMGRVGTGFSDEMRAQLPEYVGRVARIKAQKQLPSGAYFAPRFYSLHEDY